MTRRELIEICLGFPGAFEDYPFDPDPGSEDAWTVMRHQLNQKSFALIYERGGLCVNLKCGPVRADFLRQVYRGVAPAYHMNKAHWNTVLVHSDVPEAELFAMVEHSYRLTIPPQKKQAVILIGLQASGKRAFYQKNFPSYAHIHPDTLKTREKERELLGQCLRAGRSFVADNTNPTQRDRQRYIAPAIEAGYRVTGYFFRSGLSECIRRNERRETGHAPPSAIAAASKKLEPPRREEGFGRLYSVYISDGAFAVEPWKERGGP